MMHPNPACAHRLLGIDPGTRATGWGVIDCDVRGRATGVAAGVIRLGAGGLADRLAALQAQLVTIVERYAPRTAVVEEIFIAKHARAALQLGHARGVVLATLACHAVTIQTLSPALVKRAVAGHGQADKRQVAAHVGALLRLEKLPAIDATDALALALAGSRNLSALAPFSGTHTTSAVWRRPA